MEKNVNRCVVVSERPRYTVPTANIFRLVTKPKPQAGPKQVLIRTVWLGLDAYLYRAAKRAPIDSVMEGATVGRVEVSNHPDYAVGDLVHGAWGWQDFHVSDGSNIEKVDADIPKPTHMLGALGKSGFGAYITVNELMRVKERDVVTLSAALGGLGQIVGQMSKMKGAMVIAGSSTPEKCKYAVEEMRFDFCKDRKSKTFAEDALKLYSQYGIDCYAMSTGGKVLEVAMPYIRPGARIAICGIMAFYALATLPRGTDKTMAVLDQVQQKRLELRGLVTEAWYGTPQHAQFKADMKQWLREGKIKPLEHIVKGLENAPNMMQGLFEGKNFGKLIIQVSD